MKQIDLIDIHMTAPYYLQGDVSVLRARDYEMSILRLQNGSEKSFLYIYIREEIKLESNKINWRKLIVIKN